jgi:hypothetical protein
MHYTICPYCNKKLKFITPSHLKTHNKTVNDLKNEHKDTKILCEQTLKQINKNRSKGTKQKKSIKYIKNYLIENNINYKLISKKYFNSGKKLKWMCDKKHSFKMTWTSFQQGNRCPLCYGTPKKTIEEITSFLKSINYKWVGNNYKNIYSKLKVLCPNNHISEIRFDGLQAGVKCHECHNEWKRINFSKSGNPNWRGGIKSEPYCSIWSDLEFKEYIKFRDNYRCLNPCCLKSSDILVVHHIDYNKQNCNQFNLITLCNSCNTQANFNREWFTEWYKAIIFQRYSKEKIE